MYLIRYLHLQAKKNSYFIFFFFIGLFLNLNFSYTDVCERFTNISSITGGAPIKINPAVTSSQTQNSAKKLIRPRYYSTELGIREKLFVGVLTSVDQIDSRAVAVNKTVAHLIDKIKYFMSASHRYKTSHSLGNIVGFTDTRESLRPFHIIKYISDGFAQNYDYFFLMKDASYLNAHLLKYIVNKISVSQDVYLGTRMADSSFCSLDSGILLSNSVIVATRANLEWCVKNSFSDNHSDNLGRCIAHSIGLECQSKIQGQTLTSFRLKHYSVHKNLHELSTNSLFNTATVTFPVSTVQDMYTLHAYHARASASWAQTEANKLKQLILEMRPDLPHGFRDISWPVGHRPGNSPTTRFDVLRHTYFNQTHKFFNSDYSNVKQLTTSEHQDIKNVLEVVIARAQYENGNILKYRRLVNGYSVFDLSRGIDYIIDIGFKDLTTGKEIIKRFQICKPLGKVEMLAMPYVTENKRVTVLIPVHEHHMESVQNFMDMYTKSIMDHGQKTFVMFALLYTYESPSKGDLDTFLPIKNLAMKITNKFHQENSKVAWVSIRLPQLNSSGVINNFNKDVLSLAIVDLALKKIGLDSLVLVVDLHVDVTIDFLNRVRMNTIMGSQIFNIIPFRQYHPVLSETDKLEVHKTTGQFDSSQYKYISFYGRDYVNTRLLAEDNIPIVRTDRDIQGLLDVKLSEDWNVFKLFIRYSPGLNCMRATDPGLKVKYEGKSKSLMGSKTQLAKLILTFGQTNF